MPPSSPPSSAWYAGVTREQWVVLAIASAGWVFDTFEGQVFNITRGQMLTELLGTRGGPGEVRRWGDLFLAIFLVGGTTGGVLFGTLADRFGRKPTMAATILIYSVFSGLTYFATELWHVAVLRFLVALGVGGEWAVAAALVAEVFPTRRAPMPPGSSTPRACSAPGSRPWPGWPSGRGGGTPISSGSSRPCWSSGSVPGSASRNAGDRAGAGPHRRGSFRELFGDARWARPAVLGVGLAAVGMGTFWGVTVAGQDLAQELLLRTGATADVASQRAKFAYGIVQAAGGGLGLLCFGPLAERLGRRAAFALMHVLALAIVPVTCYLPQTYGQLLVLLPFFGFFTLSIHAGYAVYFPELFPDHLRATGSGVCFNGGRLLAAPILGISSALKAIPGVDIRLAITMLSSLFLLGLVFIWFLPETKGKPLPESGEPPRTTTIKETGG